ncbi:MAG: hypothetical protein AAFR53_03105 [Pseudomonadota bacterium]
MTKLLAALATGLFCSIFALVVDAITDALAIWQLMGLAALSGFCGSLFGNTLVGRRK